MRLSLDIRPSLYGGNTTDLSIDGRLVYSEDDPTPYQILQVLCGYIPGVELDPLGVEELLIYKAREVVYD
jgi:hypothetical protein